MTNPDREELVKFDLFTPDELAVRLDEWANCLDKAQMDLRSDLRCAAIHLRRLASSDGGVKVRELEWVERTGVAGTFDASTSVGHYIAEIYRDWETDRKSTRLNSSHRSLSRMPSSA